MRIARFKISPQALGDFLATGNGRWWTITEGIPKGSKIVRAGYDALTDSFYLVAEHDSFDECPEGALIPERFVTVKQQVRE